MLALAWQALQMKPASTSAGQERLLSLVCRFVMGKSGCYLACSRTCGHGLLSAAGMAARFAAFACDHQAKVFLSACAHATPQCHMRWACARMHCRGMPGRCLCTAASQCRHRTSAWLSRGKASPILRLRLIAALPKACKRCEG